MPPAALTIGGIVAGGALSYAGAHEQANATGEAAQAQLEAQRAQQERALGFASPTVAELQLQFDQMKTLDSSLTRQESLLNAVDPALMEAGKQALQLMRGQDAATIAPLRTELATQRKQLVNDLNDQYGPGGETSSAGIQALMRFDQQAAVTISGAQQDALKTLLGTSLNARPNPYGGVAAAGETLGGLQNQQRLQVGALTGNSITPFAGAPFVSSAMSGQALSGVGQSVAGLGTTLGAFSLLNGGGGSAPPLNPGETSDLSTNLRLLNGGGGGTGQVDMGSVNKAM